MRIKGNIERILFGIILLVLLIPVIQSLLGIVKEVPLNGKVHRIEEPSLKYENIWNGTYQDSLSQYFNENFGLRNEFIRLYNQVRFTAFGIMAGSESVKGKDNYFFQRDYIDYYYSTEEKSEGYLDSVNRRVNELVGAEMVLAKNGQSLLIIMAPSKAWFFPEKIPVMWKPIKLDRSLNTYLNYQKLLKDKDINFIDFNDHFLSKKDKSEYPIFPQFGIHWSIYGAHLAADSVLSFLNKKGIDSLQGLAVERTDVTLDIQYPDHDLSLTTNLIDYMQEPAKAYNYLVKNHPTSSMKVLTIGDSFYWQMWRDEALRTVWPKSEFWFYNNRYFNAEHWKDKKLWHNRNEKRERFNDAELIIVIASETNFDEIIDAFVSEVKLNN